MENPYTNLFNLANDTILIVDESGKIIDPNERASTTDGTSANNCSKKNVADLRNPSSRITVLEDMKAVHENMWNLFETIQQTKIGKLIFVDMSSQFYKNWKTLQIFSVFFSISAIRKNAEDRIHQSDPILIKAQQVAKIGSS